MRLPLSMLGVFLIGCGGPLFTIVSDSDSGDGTEAEDPKFDGGLETSVQEDSAISLPDTSLVEADSGVDSSLIDKFDSGIVIESDASEGACPGCIAEGTCQSGFDNDSCGHGGELCVNCSATNAPYCANWAPGGWGCVN